MRKLYLGILIAGALPVLALAQSAVAVPTPANPGFVDKLLADAYPYIMAALATLVSTILGWASIQLKRFLDRDKLKEARADARQAGTDAVAIVNEEKKGLKDRLPAGAHLSPAIAQKLEDKALDIAARIMRDNADPKGTLDVLSDTEKKAMILQAVEAAKPVVAVPTAAPAVDPPKPMPQTIPLDGL